MNVQAVNFKFIQNKGPGAPNCIAEPNYLKYLRIRYVQYLGARNRKA